MPSIRITSKRQAAFPVQVCDELNLRPGDVVDLELAEVGGEQVWVLRPRESPRRPWLGCLAAKTSVTEHSLDAIRASIAAGRQREAR